MIFLTFCLNFDTFNTRVRGYIMKNKAVLICEECLSRNYEVKKSTGPTRFQAKKYCKKCKKHTIHKEGK